jgi:hypothetical protein
MSDATKSLPEGKARMAMRYLVLAIVALVSITAASAALSQSPPPDGVFVRGSDGSSWVVSSGTRYRIAFLDDNGSLEALPDGGTVSSLVEVPSGAPQSPPPSPAPSMVSPAPAPNDPVSSLIGQSADGLCANISQSQFAITVDQAIGRQVVSGQATDGLWVIVIGRVTNTGNRPDDPFLTFRLQDERGRQFAQLGGFESPDLPPLLAEFSAQRHSTSIQPGLSAKALFLFEAPADVRELRVVSSNPGCR